MYADGRTSLVLVKRAEWARSRGGREGREGESTPGPSEYGSARPDRGIGCLFLQVSCSKPGPGFSFTERFIHQSQFTLLPYTPVHGHNRCNRVSTSGPFIIERIDL